MKKIVSIIGILLCLQLLSAQKPSLTKAYNFFYDKNFLKAKEMIDLCVQDEKLSGKAQTWLYKGNICYFLANEEYSAKQKDASVVIDHPDAPVEAYAAFRKSLELNPNAEAMDMFTAKEAMKQLYPLLLVRGVDQLIEKDYAAAKQTLAMSMESYEMDKPQYPMNGEIYYYYAYTLESMGETADAPKYYQKALDDGSQNPYVFARLLELYKNSNNKASAEAVVKKAKEMLPNAASTSLAEVDYLYWTGDSVGARKVLNNINASSLTNPDDIVNLANFHIKEKRYDLATPLLEYANRLSPDNFVILYNLGVCKYCLHEEAFKNYNDLLLTNSSQKDYYKEISDKSLQQSADYFEQARKLNPTDTSLLNTLRSIYVQQQSPKAEEIERILKSLE
ncbi:MAG: tetratricopeptide repeat protein [Bacteroidales bacterium]|nr:tetratricopeptide repeat protein [Bacteroidales bacterium]